MRERLEDGATGYTYYTVVAGEDHGGLLDEGFFTQTEVEAQALYGTAKLENGYVDTLGMMGPDDNLYWYQEAESTVLVDNTRHPPDFCHVATMKAVKRAGQRVEDWYWNYLLSTDSGYFNGAVMTSVPCVPDGSEEIVYKGFVYNFVPSRYAGGKGGRMRDTRDMQLSNRQRLVRSKEYSSKKRARQQAIQKKKRGYWAQRDEYRAMAGSQN